MPGWIWAVIAGVAFGFSQLSNRGVNREMDALRASTAMVTALFGFLVAAVVLSGQVSVLEDLTLVAAFWFVAAALIHFLAGWTAFAFSQQRVGPSRTAALLSANPVMAAVIAWLVLMEDLRLVTWFGVVAVTAGVAVITTGRIKSGRWTNPSLALVATLCFSISPIFVRWGLDEFDHSLVGLTVGMAVTVPAMHVASWLRTRQPVRVSRSAWPWLLSGGTAAALGLTAQWTALSLIPVGAAISLQQTSTPLVMFLGPVILSAPAERVTPRLLLGSALIISGSVAVALFGRTL